MKIPGLPRLPVLRHLWRPAVPSTAREPECFQHLPAELHGGMANLARRIKFVRRQDGAEAFTPNHHADGGSYGQVAHDDRAALKTDQPRVIRVELFQGLPDQLGLGEVR